MWLEGWEETLGALAPRAWAFLTRASLLIAAADLAALAVAFAVLRPPGPAAAAAATAAVPASRGGVAWLPAAAAALAAEAAAVLPGWALAGGAAAVSLAAAMLAAPPRVRVGLLRRLMHALVRRSCTDMWELHAVWGRGLSYGREYWVAESEGGGGQVVAGAALRYGAALRPPPPPPPPAGGADVTAGGGGGGRGAAKAAEEEEDATGFNRFERKLQGPGGGLLPTDAVLFRMVTDSRLRRRGIGKALVGRMVDRAAEVGGGRLLLTSANPHALAFYKACGFGPLHELPGGGATLWRALDGGGGGKAGL
ncbi:hypothetical protein TSOC_002310 [Tetrabaena socialis]|uniref:N-acetyltransferase domain-containing protein n=1 Tax=Tetrabaena socialis TaxID=47790 RepID=A0A2J8AEF9_9CHLO|nr:hypothetical protein TSOC_002310 [Tetrabaena socialis]|eukprot:PNH10908.1 hypothetical protein TSOC_002310 [Tetrabaena socialis]